MKGERLEKIGDIKHSDRELTELRNDRNLNGGEIGEDSKKIDTDKEEKSREVKMKIRKESVEDVKLNIRMKESRG